MKAVTHIPSDIDVDLKRHKVRIKWSDDHRSTYNFDLLRDQCPCAVCDEERKKAATEPLFIRPKVKGELLADRPAALVGQYAIQFFWKDGHNSGIYAFDYLHTLDKKSTDVD